MTDDFGPGDVLIAVDVIAVVMRVDQMTKRFISGRC